MTNDDDTRGPDAPRRASREDKRDLAQRPDAPTPSDDATLPDRHEGSNAEFVDAPSSLSDPPPASSPDTEDTEEA